MEEEARLASLESENFTEEELLRAREALRQQIALEHEQAQKDAERARYPYFAQLISLLRDSFDDCKFQ